MSETGYERDESVEAVVSEIAERKKVLREIHGIHDGTAELLGG